MLGGARPSSGVMTTPEKNPVGPRKGAEHLPRLVQACHGSRGYDGLVADLIDVGRDLVAMPGFSGSRVVRGLLLPGTPGRRPVRVIPEPRPRTARARPPAPRTADDSLPSSLVRRYPRLSPATRATVFPGSSSPFPHEGSGHQNPPAMTMPNHPPEIGWFLGRHLDRLGPPNHRGAV